MTDHVPLEAYYDQRLPSSPAVSPDGERVAYVVSEFDREEDERRRSLFVAPADGSRDPHRLTRVADAGSPAWSPDGRMLAFTAARDEDTELAVDDGDEEADGAEDDEEANGDDEVKSQVWVFDMERGGDPRQVTSFDEGVRSFDWGPDGERIVVAARDPTDEEQTYLDRRREEDGPIETERLQHKYDGAGWLDTVTTYLFVVDLGSRESTKLEDASGAGAMEPATGLQPAWGPGDRIAFTTNRADSPDDSQAMDVHTIAPDGSDLTRLTEERMAGGLSWSPDGSSLAFTASPPDNWYVPTEAYVADPDAGTVESLSADLNRTVARGGAPAWVDDETLLTLVGDEGWTRPVRLHVDGDPERVLDRLPRDETLTGFDADGGTTAVVASSADAGKEVYAMATAAVDADAREADRRVPLSDCFGAFADAHAMPETRRFTFESDDGETVAAIAYHPADVDLDESEPLPAVLKIHGGPMAYDAPGYGFDETAYTSRGYLVLEVNYRGSTSYGQQFCETLKGNWNTKDVADLQAGVDAAVDRGWADPERLFCTGFSQGGVNTAFLVTATDRFAAAAAEHGVYDLRADFGNADAHNWYEADFGLPWEEPEAYDRASSITDVDAVDTPLLVTAGGQDWRCPPTQGEELYVMVRKQGVEAKLVVYPDEHHNIADPDRAVHRLEELTGWFERFDPE